MITTLLTISSDASIESQIVPAAKSILSGDLVCCPTETVYGLCANALNPAAVSRIFHAKGRPSDNPLIVHISSLEMLSTVAAEVSPYALQLMNHFWPGPISFVLPALPSLSSTVTGGLNTVAVRMPAHPIMIQLIESTCVPLAAPSANLSGRPSPTLASHCLEDFNGKVPIIIDGGACSVGIESTVVDVTGENPLILRPGLIGYSEISPVFGKILDENLDLNAIKRSPGTRYKHYAPIGDVSLVDDWSAIDVDSLKSNTAFLCSSEFISVLSNLISSLNLKYEVIGLEKSNVIFDHTDILLIDMGQNCLDFASGFYLALRKCDEFSISRIFIQKFKENSSISIALMNRMYKSAAKE
ncbi:hypothetical protein RCL1_000892 [Eukaryota sp. TZLM3-RCL]